MEKVEDFINSIPQINFLKPDGSPEKDWKIFPGKGLDSACDAAYKASADLILGDFRYQRYQKIAMAIDAAVTGSFFELQKFSDRAEASLKKAFKGAWEPAGRDARREVLNLVGLFFIGEKSKFKARYKKGQYDKDLVYTRECWRVWEKATVFIERSRGSCMSITKIDLDAQQGAGADANSLQKMRSVGAAQL